MAEWVDVGEAKGIDTYASTVIVIKVGLSVEEIAWSCEDRHRWYISLT